MARLTNALRQTIVSAVGKYTFRVRAADLAREEEALAFKFRGAYLGEHQDAYLALPGFLTEDAQSIRIGLHRLGQDHDCFHLFFHPTIGISPQYGIDAPRYWSFVNKSSKTPEVFPKTYEVNAKDVLGVALYNRLVKYVEQYEKLEEDVQKLSLTLSTQLSACTTTEKLIKQWPEVSDFIPAATNPLVVQIDRTRTNKMIACMESGTCT